MWTILVLLFIASVVIFLEGFLEPDNYKIIIGGLLVIITVSTLLILKSSEEFKPINICLTKYLKEILII